MELVNNKILHGSTSSLSSSKFQTCVFDDPMMSHGVNEYYQKHVVEEEDGSQSNNGVSNDSASPTITHSPPLCGSSNNVNGYVYKRTSYQLEEAESLIDFKANNEYSNNIMQLGSESLLSFQQSWNMVSTENNNLHQGYSQWNHVVSPKSTTNLRMVQDLSSYSSLFNSAKEKQCGESSYGWLYSEPNVPGDHSLKESASASATQESVLRKRSSMVYCTIASSIIPKPSTFYIMILGIVVFREELYEKWKIEIRFVFIGREYASCQCQEAMHKCKQNRKTKVKRIQGSSKCCC